ncbi:hypothetical protein NQ317_012857 [Molorchus minor]|uniref:Uncharacterized protein n=1 Tax=Molorchus minor TaxID=1323400 RepID=A0ABQ9IV67_9CUCU|nr:hypothetical protein NQ317_012857 [Molorchus minor]
MSSESENEHLPGEVLEAAQSAVRQLIPKKSSRQYEIAYNEFKGWCSPKKIKKVSKKAVLLAYFKHKINKIKPSTLCKFVGYRPKKSRILTKKEIERFLQEAPDNRFLLEKMELLKITIDDIEDKDTIIIIIRISDSKTDTYSRPNEDIPQIPCEYQVEDFLSSMPG